MNSIDLGTLFLVAFLGSIGHCIGMCGGFVMAYSAAKVDNQWNRSHQAMAHLLYNLGRITAYVIIGMIFGFFGKVFSFSMTSKGILFLLVGVLMVLMGLSLMGQIRFLSSVECSTTNIGFFRLAFRKLIASKTLPSFYFLGMLNGLIPCGFVYFFAAFAAATASPFWGGVVMLVFGLATIPVLFLLGYFSSLMQQMKFRHVALQIAGILVVLYGIYTGYKGYMFLEHPEMVQKKMIHMKQKLHEKIEKVQGR
ncbi:MULTISPECIES: sulfite exporter TauE/SafE family protein [unclassified Nitratiruptor]|uniref:sulfite exporter TauE/SafE family protein n=1 Tax=unclassified Nitratiruptor TaxID=2624044 RepID=UPI00191653BE|nr:MULTISPECIES: sulfite exporter TauE/SafE family protein [unclassified Nitratiruptor]BCD61025.1 heavy-metal-associated protein [Nitratiruptor sp. YY08-10]BCD64957.1 heavy-metal-associated protein [Nitratiruptor sp. YY08-14]